MKDVNQNQIWGNFTQAMLTTQACQQIKGGCGCGNDDIPPPPPGSNSSTGG